MKTLCTIAALALALTLGAAAPPLDEKEVVRLFVAGTPVAEILQQIASREPNFDLSPEMLDELRLAGLPAELIEAMRRRQPAPAQTAIEVPVPPAPEPDAKPLLRIRLELDGAQTIPLPAEIDPALATAWGLTGREQRRVEGLAVYAACLSSTHVPDQWRSRSPLGRDFHSMPRHELLAFLALHTEPAADGGLRVELPERIDVPLEPGAAHDLSLGLAVGAAGRYFRVASVERPAVSSSAGPMALEIAVRRGQGLAGFEVRWATDDRGP